MADILYQEEGSVASVTLNRPEALNAFNKSAREEFLAAMLKAAKSATVRAVVVSGAGRGFCSGTDLTENIDAADVRRILEAEYVPGIQAIGRIPKPVIAAVHGFATGIGVSYALACDLVVMGRQAFMQIPFSRIGLIPDGGLCWHLTHRLGHRLAFELAAEGERISADRCRELGLVNRVVDDAQVLDEARSWAARLAKQASLALGNTKLALREAGRATFEETMSLEALYQSECAGSGDFREGVTAFLQKRPPNFTGN